MLHDIVLPWEKNYQGLEVSRTETLPSAPTEPLHLSSTRPETASSRKATCPSVLQISATAPPCLILPLAGHLSLNPQISQDCRRNVSRYRPCRPFSCPVREDNSHTSVPHSCRYTRQHPPPPSPAPATAGPGQPGQPSPAGTESTSQHHDSLDNVFTVRRPPAPAPPRSLLEMQSRRPALALPNPKKRSLIPLSWLLLPSCYPLEVTSLRGCHPGPSERSRTDLLSLRNTVDSCCFSKGL